VLKLKKNNSGTKGLKKVVHVTLVQAVMLFPQLTITCEMISHIAQSGTEYRDSKAIHIQSSTDP